jgi:8-oxo-dGTP diphosphatase
MSTQKSPRPLTHVAVGVILSPDGQQVLLGQRPEGKPYAGWWELPGGKLEPSESVLDALARELHEELGIDVLESATWRQLDHEYPHAHVRLHFCKVTRFSGDPQSREGQALAWSRIDQVNLEPLLPATLPVLDWLKNAQ